MYSKILTAGKLMGLSAALAAVLVSSSTSQAAPLFPGRPCTADVEMSAPLTPTPSQPAVCKVCKKPPKAAPKPRPKPNPFSGMRPLRVTATAYALRGRTSQGTTVSTGTIAVDPHVIPYGSKVYVPGYGWGQALDTGGAIRGNTIDLWMPSNRDCFSWGVRNVQIMVGEAPSHRALLASRGGRRRAHPTKKP